MADPAVVPMSAYRDYLAIAALGLGAIGVVGITLTLVHIVSRWLAGITVQPVKTGTYECGEEPVGSAWTRFNLRFYVVAIIFLVFDIELALVLPTLPGFPAAIAAGDGLWVFAKIFLFVATLLAGLWYAAAKGDFAWDKTTGRRAGGLAARRALNKERP